MITPYEFLMKYGLPLIGLAVIADAFIFGIVVVVAHGRSRKE